jgi:dolichol kinase
VLAAAVSPYITLGPYGAATVLAIAAVSALVEAVSPHGWDNLTMQIIPSALAWAWLA